MTKRIKFDSVVITKSDRDKKFKAVFRNKEGKKKTLHFGAKGMSDFTKNKDPKRKERYLKRHSAKELKENWKVPDTPASLSRWILWNKPSLESSIKDYKKKFGLS